MKKKSNLKREDKRTNIKRGREIKNRVIIPKLKR